MGNGSKVLDTRKINTNVTRVVDDIREAYLDDVITKIDFEEDGGHSIHLVHGGEIKEMMTRLDNYLSIDGYASRCGLTFTKSCLESLPGVTRSEDGYDFSSHFITLVYPLFINRYKGCETYREWVQTQREVNRLARRKGVTAKHP